MGFIRDIIDQIRAGQEKEELDELNNFEMRVRHFTATVEARTFSPQRLLYNYELLYTEAQYHKGLNWYELQQKLPKPVDLAVKFRLDVLGLKARSKPLRDPNEGARVMTIANTTDMIVHTFNKMTVTWGLNDQDPIAR